MISESVPSTGNSCPHYYPSRKTPSQPLTAHAILVPSADTAAVESMLQDHVNRTRDTVLDIYAKLQKLGEDTEERGHTHAPAA